MAPPEPLHALGDAAQPDLCRRLYLRSARHRPAPAGAGTPRHRARGRGGAGGADQGSGGGLHELGQLRAEPGASGSQPQSTRGDRPRRPGALGRSAGLRPMRPAHGHAVSQSRTLSALFLLAIGGELRRCRLPVAERHALDALVASLMLEALQPAALEVTLQLLEDLELERAALHRQWQQRLERARYEAERAHRQYDAVEPENRLVARTLEQRSGEALSMELRLKADYD